MITIATPQKHHVATTKKCKMVKTHMNKKFTKIKPYIDLIGFEGYVKRKVKNHECSVIRPLEEIERLRTRVVNLVWLL